MSSAAALAARLLECDVIFEPLNRARRPRFGVRPKLSYATGAVLSDAAIDE